VNLKNTNIYQNKHTMSKGYGKVAAPQSFHPDPDPNPITTKNRKKLQQKKKSHFCLDQKLQFTYPQASIKKVQ
jgi:hypothetical protein